MLTEAMIRRLAPHAREEYVKTLLAGGSLFEEYGITTPRRMAAFLATAMHETGQLTVLRENMNYTAANLVKNFGKRYKGRPDLAAAHAGNPKLVANFNYGFRMGNQDNGIKDDDGWLFRGGGFFQTTGKDNYRRMGALAGVDLVANPDLINDPMVSLEAACAEAKQFHQFADRGEPGFLAYSNGVNRGDPSAKDPPNGWADRLKQYRRVVALLPTQAAPEQDDTSELGDRGALIEGYQKRLQELRYPVGAIDGIFGAHTQAAVLAFQAQNGIKTDGQIGPVTRAALNKADAKPMPISVDRATATADDLAKQGSGTIIDARTAKSAGEAIVGISVVKGVQDQVDILGTIQGWTTDLGAMRAVIDPAIVALKWALSAWWLFAIVAGIIILRKTNAIERARVAAHQLGQHLGR